MTDPLVALLDQVMGRTTKRDKIHIPKPLHVRRREHKIFFDADRFRWYFHKHEGKTLQQWRDAIDEEMLKDEANEHT